MRIEFHQAVPAKIREAVVDAVRAKEVTEGLTGMVCDISDFWIALPGFDTEWTYYKGE